jgi:Ca2+-binding RTX toxin-like protein
MKRATIVALVVALVLALSAGAALAADIVCPGFECYGTSHKDTMHGTINTPNIDFMFGKVDNDTLYGLGGDDRLYADGTLVEASDGSYRHPGIWKHAGDDILYGGPGDDYLFGYNGDDKLKGGPGNDKISALDSGRSKAGTDHISGFLGNDSITAHDGFADVIDCGPGKDFVYFDKGLDRVKGNCERRAWPPKGKKECLPVEYPLEQVENGLGEIPVDYLSIRRIVGTNGKDRLVGTDHEGCIDVMVGRGGNDTLRGLRGVDGLEGGPGSDTLGGGPGDDGLFGNYANFTLLSENSHDTIHGGDGNDFIDVRDENPQPAQPDTVSCDAGVADWAEVDGEGTTGENNLVPIDNVDLTNCERVDSFQEEFIKWFRWMRRR